MIEDDALADVRPTHDRHDEICIVSQLWPQFVAQEFVPFAARERSDAGLRCFVVQTMDAVVQPTNPFSKLRDWNRHKSVAEE